MMKITFRKVLSANDVGLTGGGKGTHQIYVNGITDHIIKNENVADYIVKFVESKIPDFN